MLVIEDGDGVALVPHWSFVDLADRATAAVTTPKLTSAHIGTSLVSRCTTNLNRSARSVWSMTRPSNRKRET